MLRTRLKTSLKNTKLKVVLNFQEVFKWLGRGLLREFTLETLLEPN